MIAAPLVGPYIWKTKTKRTNMLHGQLAATLKTLRFHAALNHNLSVEYAAAAAAAVCQACKVFKLLESMNFSSTVMHYLLCPKYPTVCIQYNILLYQYLVHSANY